MIEGVYHFEVLTISRKAGRTATAASAYRAGVLVTDEQSGETFDYRRKQDVLYSEVVVPTVSPREYTERSFLWNAVERSEKRKNATLARDLQIALPAQLEFEHQVALVRRFVRALVDKHGPAIDFAIHAPYDKESVNTHAHLLMSTRRLANSGFTEKMREWDEVFARGPKTVVEARELWAKCVNEAYAAAGIAMFVDHRSHKERGLTSTPTIKMGVAATAMERRGVTSRLGNLNRSIKEKNERG